MQSTWIKASVTVGERPRNPAAWLTTVLTRVCLDQLRTRSRRREEPLFADLPPAEVFAADERYLQRESVSRALMVVLDRLTPAQRVAYVLHDLFGMTFAEVTDVLGTSPASAKKHASRARGRLQAPASAPPAAPAVVDAFLTAAGGDLNRMVALMADGCVRVLDPALVPPGTPTVVTGARAIAEETGLFAARIRAGTWVLADGCPTHVLAPGGHPLAVVDITLDDERGRPHRHPPRTLEGGVHACLPGRRVGVIHRTVRPAPGPRRSGNTGPRCGTSRPIRARRRCGPPPAPGT